MDLGLSEFWLAIYYKEMVYMLEENGILVLGCFCIVIIERSWVGDDIKRVY